MIKGTLWVPMNLPLEKAVSIPMFDNAEILDADGTGGGGTLFLHFQLDVAIDVSGPEPKCVAPKGIKMVRLLFDEEVDRAPAGTRLLGLIKPLDGPRHAIRLVTEG